jgi:hypothetical protein
MIWLSFRAPTNPFRIACVKMAVRNSRWVGSDVGTDDLPPRSIKDESASKVHAWQRLPVCVLRRMTIRASRDAEKDVKSLAKESDVLIYSIGIFDEYVPTDEEALGPVLLSEIAEPTGGQAYTIVNLNMMSLIARHISMKLRTQYVLAYRPQDPPHKGKWRKIRVQLLLFGKLAFLHVHARSGFLVLTHRFLLPPSEHSGSDRSATRS